MKFNYWHKELLSSMLSALEKNWYIWTTKEKNSDELGIRGICEKGLNPNSLLSPLQALFLLKLDITDNLLWEYHVIKKTAWLQVNGNILKEKTIWSYLERLANRWSIYSYIKLKLNIYVQRRRMICEKLGGCVVFLFSHWSTSFIL